MILLRIAGFIVYNKNYSADESTEKVASEASGFEQVIDLLDVLIWPLTVFFCLLLFKNQIAKIIGSLGSIKAGTDGIELNFIEEKLQEATKLIGIGPDGITAKGGGSIKPKGSGSIKPKGGSSIKPKSGTQIIPNDVDKSNVSRSHAETPYQELLALQDILNQELNKLANNHGLNLSGTSNFALTNDLANHDIIDSQTASQLKTLIELINYGLRSSSITYDHTIQMKKLYNNISF